MYKISYIADGATTEFAFSFPFFQTADVRVAIDEVIDGENQIKVVLGLNMTDFIINY